MRNPPAEAMEAVAYLKRWWQDGLPRCRVDMTDVCEPWLDNLKPEIVPLYTRPTLPEGLVDRLNKLIAVRRDFVAKREAMNAAIPDAMTATPAERALYDERYRADHEAERALFREAQQFAAWAADTNPLATLSPTPPVSGLGDYAREASKALTRLSGGGSEMFKQIGDEFYADPDLCVQRAEEKQRKLIDLRSTPAPDAMLSHARTAAYGIERVEKLRGALVEAAIPLEAMLMVGNSDGRHSSELWEGVESAVQHIRAALRTDGGSDD